MVPSRILESTCRLTVAVALLGALPGCKPASARLEYDPTKVSSQPVDGGTYVEASIGDASFLNPLLSTDSASNDINSLVFNGLVKYDKDIKLVGDLAERFEFSNGGKVITFHLRKNVKWHDGVPFTAADVYFTYQKLIDPKTQTPFSANYKEVKLAEVLDPYTFRVSYSKVLAPALESWGIGIIPKHLYEKGEINTHPNNKWPIGTGPYKFYLWKTDEKIELRANPDYFEGRPHLDRYVYQIIPDMSVQFLELRQGSLSTLAPSPDQYNGYQEFFEYYNKFKYPALRYDYIAFNLDNKLFKDVRVRRAIAHAVDKKTIINAVYEGLAVSATGPFPPQSWAFDPSVPDYEFDLEKSKALLAEAGWVDSDEDGLVDKNGEPFSFTLITNQGNKVRESIALIVQDSLKKVGIEMDLRIIEWSVFLHKFIDPRNFDACLLAWNLSQDPDNSETWHSKEIGPGRYNMSSYANANVDEWLTNARATVNQKERQRYYWKIHRQIAADMPYVFLVTPMRLPVVHKKILGVELAPAGLGWNFQHWFIPKEWQGNTNARLSS